MVHVFFRPITGKDWLVFRCTWSLAYLPAPLSANSEVAPFLKTRVPWLWASFHTRLWRRFWLFCYYEILEYNYRSNVVNISKGHDIERQIAFLIVWTDLFPWEGHAHSTQYFCPPNLTSGKLYSIFYLFQIKRQQLYLVSICNPLFPRQAHLC